MADLNPRQLRFIDEYFKDFNGTQAAIRAGYSPRGADCQAVRLLGNARVAEEVNRRKLENRKLLKVTRDRWLRELACVAFVDPGKMFDNHGNLIEICEMAPRLRRAIAGFEFYEEFEGKGEARKAVGYTRKFKLVDKLQALKLFGEAMGYFDPVPVSGENSRSLNIVFVSPDGKKSMAAQPPRAVSPSPQVGVVSSCGEG